MSPVQRMRSPNNSFWWVSFNAYALRAKFNQRNQCRNGEVLHSCKNQTSASTDAPVCRQLILFQVAIVVDVGPVPMQTRSGGCIEDFVRSQLKLERPSTATQSSWGLNEGGDALFWRRFAFKRARIFEVFDGSLSSGTSGTYRDFGHIFDSAADYPFQALRLMMLRRNT